MEKSDLKIIDNVDLKELEKFGFNENILNDEEVYIYDFIPYTKEESSFLVISFSDRIINTDYVDDINPVLGVVFKLFQAGLVVVDCGENEKKEWGGK